MKERPILFSGRMVLAILAGLKTQTRRIPPREMWDDESAMLAWGRKRFGDPGDVLYVREAHAVEELAGDGTLIVYRADRAARWEGEGIEDIFYLASDYEPPRWRPGIHMVKVVSRIKLLRTEPLRVERLHDIRQVDILGEGFACPKHGNKPGGGACPSGCRHLRFGFFAGWDAINGKRGPTSENPPVIPIGFGRQEARAA
jgi:hypothetical protein